jgi:hypothetical protein
MIIPVGPDGGNQELLQVRHANFAPLMDTQVDREGDSDFRIVSLMGVRYVPLVK